MLCNINHGGLELATMFRLMVKAGFNWKDKIRLEGVNACLCVCERVTGCVTECVCQSQNRLNILCSSVPLQFMRYTFLLEINIFKSIWAGSESRRRGREV